MSSRKEEERNEKIIRGLMKLPPNRRCINCNSLGPQYVCTNFWTFVCTICSGIHREFTHRVKSVSMAKFTSQEVDALQRGGNQRAREIFLKDWDTQRQRLPDSNNADRVREFIKSVYVARRYAGERTSDKPPRDMQGQKGHEDDIRRASSYHSYSQSPPYEHQYEDRRYGKPTGILTRKPGSDRGHYEGKISSFICSPGRSMEQMYDDRFSNEGSVARVSDYSASSAGDTFRSNNQSPSFQKDVGLSSPPMRPVRDILVEDVRHQTTGTRSEVNARRDRTASAGSFGSFDSNSTSLKSVNSASLLDNALEPEQSTGTQQGGTSLFPSLPQSAASASTVSNDPFNPSFIQPVTTSSAPAIDLFADITDQHTSTNYLEQKPSTGPSTGNQGWATFDLPHHATSAPEMKHEHPASVPPGSGAAKENHEVFPSVNNSMQWPPVQGSTAHGPFSSMPNQWHADANGVPAPIAPTSSQSWNAFDDLAGNLPQASFKNLPQTSEPQFPSFTPISGDNYKSSIISQDFSKDGVQRSTVDGLTDLTFNGVITGSSFLQSAPPSMGGMPSHTHDWKSTNPFDLPYDSELEPNTLFLDMGSLQAALPNPPLPAAFLGGIADPWFPQSSVMVPATPQGGLVYIAGQAPPSQLPYHSCSQRQ
ncbi:probable ADP-ribosylation factor GTPase-activating protein AGD14 isoform X2 [Magnolia sinica]|uniref:probable ADP-ribosylation factor GTPase-activating protein AGD14 isoform X2 n=1 Tax=Magnolia sinica TaxID=86752 RepID=UPI00265B0B0A|nr:probable ADP-ribosylation factor GTPase-activating protein AGD14 isoform X2 [Magnolia sinica]